MWDLKKGTNSHGWLASWLEHGANFKKVQTEIELQMLKKKNLWLSGGKGRRDKLGDWDWHIHTTIYKTDN